LPVLALSPGRQSEIRRNTLVSGSWAKAWLFWPCATGYQATSSDRRTGCVRAVRTCSFWGAGGVEGSAVGSIVEED